jgi:hypothetical protein
MAEFLVGLLNIVLGLVMLAYVVFMVVLMVSVVLPLGWKILQCAF